MRFLLRRGKTLCPVYLTAHCVVRMSAAGYTILHTAGKATWSLRSQRLLKHQASTTHKVGVLFVKRFIRHKSNV